MSLGSSHITILKDRAAMLSAVRSFFEKKQVLEVDTPILSKKAPIDVHIDILSTEASAGVMGYFHSSPEYGMKKLLAKGIGDIFQLCHVFRQGEVGPFHQIEFTMIEWYRKDFTFLKLLEETHELISIFLEKLPFEILRYETVFEQGFQINPFTASIDTLSAICKKEGYSSNEHSQEIYLHFLWNLLEKNLGKNKLTFITHFPSWQAALSKVFTENNKQYAARFECFYQGLELANGYHELTDPIEQKQRLIAEHHKRIEQKKMALPIDESFLSALESLHNQEFFGVAVGFDRLMMLRHHLLTIEEAVAIGWSQD